MASQEEIEAATKAIEEAYGDVLDIQSGPIAKVALEAAAKAPLPDEVADLISRLKNPMWAAGDLPVLTVGITVRDMKEAADALKRMARVIETQRNANNISIEQYRARIAELEAALEEPNAVVAEAIAECDAIEAATIERCAKAAENIYISQMIGGQARENFKAGAQLAAQIIRALAKPVKDT
jgi:hypothetical protein